MLRGAHHCFITFCAGITDIEIHFLQIKHNTIGIYLDPSIIGEHLGNWKGKNARELAADDDFFDALVSGKLVLKQEFRNFTYN